MEALVEPQSEQNLMPKKKSSRPASGQTSNRGTRHAEDLKSPSQRRRERIVKTGAIVLVLALLLSLLAGAFSVAPAQAANSAKSFHSVQISANEPKIVDTDGDGIENNQDSDVDGDGIVNGEDPDIDGDGIENFDDADPIDTTDVESNAPEKPIRPVGAGDPAVQSAGWLVTGSITVVLAAISAWLLAKRRKK